jgi:hypothetical protein
MTHNECFLSIKTNTQREAQGPSLKLNWKGKPHYTKGFAGEEGGRKARINRMNQTPQAWGGHALRWVGSSLPLMRH